MPPQVRSVDLPAASASSVNLRIIAAFASITLAVALVIGIVAMRIGTDVGLPAEVADRMRGQLLWWGFGAILLAALLGAIFARHIGEPIRRLTEHLQAGELHDFDKGSSAHREYAEVEQLSHTIHRLAESVRDREARLSESERKFREAFDLVGVGLTQVDREGRFTLVNRRFCEMLGYSREEIIGMNVSQWDAGFADADDLVRNLKQQFEQPIRSQFETRHRRKDGTVFDAEVSGFPVELAGIQLLFNSSRDIDLRKQTEERLHLQSAALETAANAIVITDTEAVIQWANPAFSALTGYSLAEAVGKCPKDLI